MTDLLTNLRTIVGKRHVLTSAAATRSYRTGYRFGSGAAVAVVRPGSLVEQWRVLQACVAADVIVITQAANTGLTGGSTPDGDDYDRDVVIVSTTRLKGVQLIGGARQVICLPGATLFELERRLRTVGREPHSVIGSSCFGASVLGGVCNNSGGALVQRGPAYTELALFARATEQGLELVNHLGVALGNEPEEMLCRLEQGRYAETDVVHDPARQASDRDYAQHVRRIDEPTPARFNADARRLYEAAGSAGRLMVFAVRLDTFPAEANSRVFYIGTDDPDELTTLRRTILGEFEHLPIAGEYMHRTAFDIARVYGKDLFLAVQHLGTDRLPGLFGWKARFENVVRRLRVFGQTPADRLMQGASRLFPEHLPRRLIEYRNRFEHHLMLRVSAGAAEEACASLAGMFPSATGDFFECTPDEGAKAFLHRFAAAGAAVRYRAVHHKEVEDIVALDVALPRNDREWLETLPADVEAPILHKLYYGHFLCHVFHQDYIVAKGHDTLALEHRMWELLDRRGAEYPAEHNIGHLYPAKPAMRDFYRELDPCNQLNPGIGQTSKHRHWAGPECH